jgi:hypothetical protein
MRQFIWAVFLFVLSTAAQAGVTIKVKGALSDADFYKAVSCGAAPGKACAEDAYRWSKAKAARLTVSLHFPDAISTNAKNAFINALSNGIQQVNGAGSGVKLSRVADGKRADIIINVIDPASMELLNGLAGGDFIAHTNISGSPIKKGQVSVNQNLTGRTLQSIILSNLMSSLGFLNNVDGGPYTNNSVMAGHANAQTRLAGQDLIALRTHYPK